MAQRKFEALTDDEVFADWKHTFGASRDEMIELGRNRRMFEMLREIVERNAKLQATGGRVPDWMFSNYVVAVSMTFRRELDRDSSVRSIRQVLREIQRRPTVLNRGRYHREWGAAAGREFLADRVFDGFGVVRIAGQLDEDHVDPAGVSSDLDRLEASTEKVRLFVEQTFAHRSRGKVSLPTFGDLHAALDQLEEVFKKYYALLTQSSLSSTRPEPQYDTHECFTFPWLPPTYG